MPLGYISLSLLIFSSSQTAYAAGSSDGGGSQLILIVASVSTAAAAIINALATRQKSGAELLDSVTATQASAFNLLQKQVESIQNDRDYYRDEVERLRRQLSELRDGD